jgi:hypothetical protein
MSAQVAADYRAFSTALGALACVRLIYNRHAVGKPLLLTQALRSYSDDLEDRLTEVLATTLEVHEGFCRLLVDRFGLEDRAAHYEICTQKTIGADRTRIDLAITGHDLRGTTSATVFVESKYNPARRLHGYWFHSDQYNRQRAALDRESGTKLLVGIASASDLDRLSGPEELRPDYDPTEKAYDAVISWNEVVAIARRAGGEPGWEQAARKPDALAAQRVLLEFVTYLNQEGAPMGAVDDDDIFVLRRSAVAEERVERLLEIAGEAVAGQVSTGADVYEVEADNESPNGSARMWVTVEPPESTWMSELRDAQLIVMITGAEYGEERSVGVPFAYAGLAWNAGKEGRDAISASAWAAKAKSAALDLYWDGNMCSVLAGKPLEQALEGGDTLHDQATRLAEWASPAIRAAMKLPNPPDADRELKKATRRQPDRGAKRGAI